MSIFERHLTVEEIAQAWGLSASTIRRLFQDAPGVLRVGRAGRRDGRRDYVSLRIPESVALAAYHDRTA
jgi:AraC-like DNA-binding protein